MLPAWATAAAAVDDRFDAGRSRLSAHELKIQNHCGEDRSS